MSPEKHFLRQARRDMGPHSCCLQADVATCVGVLGAIGVPNPRAEAGGPATGPGPATSRPPEPSDPICGARASHCIHPHMPRRRNAAAQLNGVKSERSTSRINSATVYAEADVDGSAMAASSVDCHAPVSIELGGNCWRSRANDCPSGQQDNGAHAIANHGSPHNCPYRWRQTDMPWARGEIEQRHVARAPLELLKKGRVICSFCRSNVTCSAMSSIRASGVCGQSTILVIMRGPSSSSTTAIAYGGVKPGAGR